MTSACRCRRAAAMQPQMISFYNAYRKLSKLSTGSAPRLLE
jgi:hypothetical protein